MFLCISPCVQPPALLVCTSTRINHRSRYSGRLSRRLAAVLLATRQSNGLFPKPTPSLLLSALVRSVLHCFVLCSLNIFGFSPHCVCCLCCNFLTHNSGAGLAGFFMAYSSSTNPFFMLAKDKRSIGDAGNRTPPRTLPTIALSFPAFVTIYFKYTRSTTCLQRSLSQIVPPTDIIRLI
jgi:hypothetical protein